MNFSLEGNCVVFVCNNQKKENNIVFSQKEIVFFDHIDLQIIEIDLLHKGVFCKARPRMSLKIADHRVKPDRHCQIKFRACLFERPEHFMCSGIVRGILDHRISDKAVVPPLSHP